MNTSARRSLPLIWLARPLDPPPKPWKVSPVASSNAGPMPCSIRFTSDPAYSTSTAAALAIPGARSKEVANIAAEHRDIGRILGWAG